MVAGGWLADGTVAVGCAPGGGVGLVSAAGALRLRESKESFGLLLVNAVDDKREKGA